MASLAQSGGFELAPERARRVRADFDSARARRGRGRRRHATFRSEAGSSRPHTAVGVAAARAGRADPAIPMVVLATAHPAKFPDAVEAATGIRPALPPHLADLLVRTERFTVLPNDQRRIEAFVRSHSRVASGVAA